MNTLETMIASATAHRACCGSEHDLLNGKLHGYCVVCGVQWPCETAKTFIFTSQPPYPYLAVCQDLAQILQAPLPSDGGPGDLGDLVEAIRNRMARLEDRAACLQATLDENRQLKDQLAVAASKEESSPILFHDSEAMCRVVARAEAAEAHAQEGTEIIRRLEGMLAEAKAEVEQAQENHREVLGRLFTAEARVKDLEEQACRFYTSETEYRVVPIEEVLRRRKACAARLAAIDAAKDGDPPMPQRVDFPWATINPFPVIEAMEAWGRQGWDAAAALRVEVATLQQHVQALGAPVYRAVEAERERLCRKFTSTPYLLKLHVPSSIEVVSLTFETALRHATQEPKEEPADAHPSF